MSLDIAEIKKYLPVFTEELMAEIANYGLIKEIPEGVEILKEGQYIKAIPIVLEGLVKVFTRMEEKELLLYYIGPAQSCIMSFSAGMSNAPSRIFAFTEDASIILLLPSDKLGKWVKQYPAINELFFQQYNLRYTEMLDTINSLLFDKMDQRLYNYLLEKSKLKGEKILTVRHKQIAGELGTAREVITRVMKRLEQEGKVRQLPEGIQIIQAGD
ncbi:MAG: Crp/Fnr family transcriptional regulator [Chitinophagaceae bacterium]|nr:Crp/Fnr family transcriptional regulator [Chitinophagaceae bacterium]HQV60882.1 Crp/Fnr family transcriptional regulator [Chitinophagaceae bacterium]HQV86215.1 Crp/Fnr family transcriptional regulator [Chitinophagaceae bacterium]HQX73320.1 Crp/Fnr family transcriptional regulator [Chitinophagaceae bacterium]HQZ73811.1 Crp/Fnr family transcriptional regulator [Chitinophagaceae bacterium]